MLDHPMTFLNDLLKFMINFLAKYKKFLMPMQGVESQKHQLFLVKTLSSQNWKEL